jgi:hypothetical protein
VSSSAIPEVNGQASFDHSAVSPSPRAEYERKRKVKRAG